MKDSIFFVFLSLFYFSLSAKTANVVGIDCGAGPGVLSIEDGDFIKERKLRREIKALGSPMNAVYRMVNDRYQGQPQTREILLSAFQWIGLESNNTTTTQDMPPVSDQDLLIHRGKTCREFSLISINPEGLKVSDLFHQLTYLDQAMAIYEASLYILASKYSPVAIRHMVYESVSGEWFHYKDKKLFPLLLKAGFDYYEWDSVWVDLTKPIKYSNESISIAYLVEDSQFPSKYATCVASSEKPALFLEQSLARFFVKGNCELKIKSQKYLTRHHSYISLYRNGNIESFYVKPGFRIKNHMVDLIAIGDKDKGSKVSFRPHRVDTLDQYIQFEGKFLFFGNWVEHWGITNLGVDASESFISNMWLKEEFMLNFPLGPIAFYGITSLSKDGHVQSSHVARPVKILLQGKTIEVMKDRKFLFYPSGSIRYFFVGKDIELINAKNEKQIVFAGQSIEVDHNERLIRVNPPLSMPYDNPSQWPSR